METFSALLVICAGNSLVHGEFPAQRPVTWGFNVFFDLRLNKQSSKQSWGWWFEMPSSSLWRHCNGIGDLDYLNVTDCERSYIILTGMLLHFHHLCTPVAWLIRTQNALGYTEIVTNLNDKHFRDKTVLFWGELFQYRACWWPGSLGDQNISSYGEGFLLAVEISGKCFVQMILAPVSDSNSCTLLAILHGVNKSRNHIRSFCLTFCIREIGQPLDYVNGTLITWLEWHIALNKCTRSCWTE